MYKCLVRWNKQLRRDRQEMRLSKVQSKGFGMIGFGESEGPSFGGGDKMGLKPSQ